MLTSTQFHNLIARFFAQKKSGILIYNEISLQNELGIFLKNNGFTVRFERNVRSYVPNTNSFSKKEIDIVFFDGKNEFGMSENSGRYAIELKFPRNGEYPEQMFKFIEDIKFMEEVKHNCSFDHTFVLTLVDDKLYYSGSVQNGIYQYFRNLAPIPANTPVQQPTGKKSKQLCLNNSYKINWIKPLNPYLIETSNPADVRYYLLEMK
ncbi:hypothetical protein [uncultured Bacteroides sp.]|uniref:hypothetical protein n=1 Tax=uncultured Bacteroides sp. TaxID=162156 RepID=UPI002611A81F|nr:hypothetical protein [uncultured Bacteroides sp.]